MSIEEQKKIAFDLGRLAAWLGRSHLLSDLNGFPSLTAAWHEGVESQCKTMSDAAAKVPLLFADERANSKSPVD